MVGEVLKLTAKNGYKAYKVEGHDTFGFLVTPDDNVLTVNKGIYGGIRVTFDYVQSKEHGTGCACSDVDLYECDIDTLKDLEAEGKAFARELGAKLYKNSGEWLEANYWKQRGMLWEVVA